MTWAKSRTWRRSRLAILRSSASALGDFVEAVVLSGDFEDAGGALDDGAHRVVVVELQPVDGSETVAHRGADHAVPGGRADEGEGLDGEVHAPRLEALVDDPGDEEVLHCGVEDLLDDAGEAVYLVDEEDLVLLELREGGDHVAGPLDGGAGGGLDADAELGCDDVREGGLAEAGRAVEEDVVEGLAALPGGDDGYLKVALDGLLPDVVDESTRAQGVVDVFGLFLG